MSPEELDAMADDKFIVRIKHFLASHERVSGLDPEIVYSVHSIPDDEPGMLLVSDLRRVVAEVERLGRVLLAGHENCAGEQAAISVRHGFESLQTERDEARAEVERLQRELDTMTAVAKSNKRHVQIMAQELERLDVAKRHARGEPCGAVMPDTEDHPVTCDELAGHEEYGRDHVHVGATGLIRWPTALPVQKEKP